MFESTAADVLFLLGRIVFGGTLAFMGLNHFLDVEGMSGYAAHKGLPAPTAAAVGSGAVLVLGGASIALGVVPALGAATLAFFLLVAAVTMHDFWNAEEADAQTEMTAFLKNLYGAGAAIAFATLGTVAWPYAINVGLFFG